MRVRLCQFFHFALVDFCVAGGCELLFSRIQCKIQLFYSQKWRFKINETQMCTSANKKSTNYDLSVKFLFHFHFIRLTLRVILCGCICIRNFLLSVKRLRRNESFTHFQWLFFRSLKSRYKLWFVLFNWEMWRSMNQKQLTQFVWSIILPFPANVHILMKQKTPWCNGKHTNHEFYWLWNKYTNKLLALLNKMINSNWKSV